MSIRADRKLVGIFGHPVSHTLSPAMHNAAFAALGIDGVYLAFDVRPAALAVALQGLPALDFRGVNLTVPHKQAAIEHLDRLDEEAGFIGAANTVVVEQGRLIGYNTDGVGFIESLRETGVDVAGRRVLMLGAGGAARAVGVALARAVGVAALGIANRTSERAQDLAAVLRKVNPGLALEILPLTAAALGQTMRGADIIINTTSVGLSAADALPVRGEWFGPGQVAVDLIYNPPRTDFLLKAEGGGARALNGLGMLLHQGALAFRLWTGCDPPLDAMRRALLAGLPGNGLEQVRGTKFYDRL